MRWTVTNRLMTRHVLAPKGWHMFLVLSLLPFHLQANTAPIIDESFHQVPLEDVLQHIHHTYHVFFSYRKKNVAGIEVNAQINRQPLDKAMRMILTGTNLDFEIVDERYVLIIPKAKVDQPAPKICGWVKDAETEEPLGFANVRLLGTQTGTICRKDGSFYLRGFFPPDSQVLFSYLGYEPQAFPYRQLTQRGCQTIPLERKQAEMQGVIISEYLADGINQVGNAISLTPRKVQALPGLTEPDVMQLVQVLPGVNGPTETAAGIHLRGGTPDQTLIRMDGIPMYQTGHFFDMIFATNPFAIGEAQVYRGGFHAAQPGRVSGVIDMNQGKEVPTQFGGGLTLNLTHLGVSLRIPIDSQRLGIYLSFRRSLTDVIPSTTLNQWEARIFQATRIGYQNEEAEEEDDIIEQAKAYGFADWNAKLVYQPSPRHTLSLSHFGGQNTLFYDFIRVEEEEAVQDELGIYNLGLGFQWTYQGKRGYRSNQQASLSNYLSNYAHHWRDEETDLEIWQLNRNNEVTDLRFSSDHTWQINPKHAVQVGAQFTYQDYLFNIDYFHQPTEDRGEGAIVDSALTLGLHVGYRLTPSKKWHISLSNQWRVYSLAAALLSDPRLSVTYRPNSRWRFRAHSGIYHQTISQLIEWAGDELGVNNQLWVLSDNEFVPIIRSAHSGIGVTFDRKGWLVDIEAYTKNLQNLTSLTSSFVNNTNADGDRIVYAKGNANIVGVDLLLKKRWPHMRSWVSYTLSQILYEFPTLLEDPFPAPHDQRHVLSINHLANWKHWELAIGWNYRSGKPYTPKIADQRSVSLVEANNPIYSVYHTYVQPVFGQINGRRLPDYHRLDLSVAYVFQTKGKRVKGRVGFSLLNLYNRENILSIQYFPDEAFHPHTPDLTIESEQVVKELLRTTPNVLFRLSW